jgi:hypothetical protein
MRLLFEPAEEVLDEMPPFVHVLIGGERLCAARMLGDDDLGAARVEIGDNGVAVERLVGDQRVECQSLDEAVVLTDGKAGTVENIWLDEIHGLRISIRGHDGKWPVSTIKFTQR